MRIINSFKATGLPTRDLNEKDGGFYRYAIKDKFSAEQLQQLGLNTRQIKAVLFVKERGKITDIEYQEINEVSKLTATRDLSELADRYKIFKNTGIGAGSIYELPP